MKISILFPGKYIQGAGVLSEVAENIAILGSSPILVWGKRTKKAVSDVITESFRNAGKDFSEIMFNGECTKEEAERIADEAGKKASDVIVGIGGGKAIDTAKGAAAASGLPVVVIPTLASNDAPTSACTVWYNNEGECIGFDLWKSNPDLIIVDTNVVVNAPVRTFAAGIGDALATWPEAYAAYKSRAVACSGGTPTMTALSMAKLCFDTLMEYGLEAIKAAENNIVTPAVEKVTEATVLLSGIGWESGGLACAHAIGNTLPALHETHDLMHGEKVSFGLLTQLCLDEDTDIDELYEITDFLVSAGLPVTLKDLNIQDIGKERLMQFAEMIAAEGSFANNHTFKVTAKAVYDAMIAADSLGKRRKESVL